MQTIKTYLTWHEGEGQREDAELHTHAVYWNKECTFSDLFFALQLLIDCNFRT